MFGRNGIVYGTHSLGPILSWFGWDRVNRVSCEGSGSRFSGPDGAPFKLETTCVMLCKTVQDRLIKIKNDFSSPRPGINQYVLQGEKGAYESKRPLPGGDDYVWLKDFVQGTDERWWRPDECPEQWMKLETFAMRFLPQKYKEWEAFAKNQGHEGADAFMFVDLVESLIKGEQPALDIHRGLDITLPGIMSQISIENDGAWVDVPDSRQW
jgi:hypothetical protein